jgi:hypothetical protein
VTTEENGEIISVEWKSDVLRRVEFKYKPKGYLGVDKLSKKLTPLSRVLLVKPTVTQPPQKFPSFYRTLRFIIVFTRARHWSLEPD